MKKYLLILLLACSVSNAQYNLFARQNFAKSVSAPTFNTYIGGVSATISSASSLATKLGISVGAISNFTVVGSDIKCKITGSYAIPSGAFIFNSTPCTYYRDTDYLVNAIGSDAFYFTNIAGTIDFQNAITVSDAFRATPLLTDILLKNATSVANSGFAESTNGTQTLKLCYIPSCTTLGSTSGNNSVFSGSKSFLKIYAHPSLQTNNAGGVDGDLADAISRGATVTYVTNFTAPSAITTLAAGTVYNTAIQLNFTPPSSTNAIDFYEVYANGVLKGKVTGSGQYISGLLQNTNYDIIVKTVDIFLNKSTSNTLTQTTSNSLSDTDASAYVTASSNSAYQYVIDDLFKMLKDKSLYTKTQAIYPFLGTTSTQHKWNAKNPLDTDTAFRLTFNGTATYTNSGYTPNGSTGYANTRFLPSVNQNVNSNGITLVSGTNNAVVGAYAVECSAYVSQTSYSAIYLKVTNANKEQGAVFNDNTKKAQITSANEAKGIFTGTKQSSTTLKFFRNGSVLVTGTGGGTLPNIPIYIGCSNEASSSVYFSNQRIQTVMFHEGFTDAESATLYYILDSFENSLNRKTW